MLQRASPKETFFVARAKLLVLFRINEKIIGREISDA